MRPGPEFDRIRAFVSAVRARVPELELPIGDDAAVLPVPAGERLVVSSDSSVEGVHFQRAWLRWEAVGYRAAAAALSDLAAMAARPLGVLVSLMVAPELEQSTLVALGDGFGECLRRHGAGLLGGDLAHSPGGLAIDVAAIGASRSPVSRGGARDGDEVWLTGSIGGSAAALQAWRRSMEPDPRARAAFERPPTRIAEALWLNEQARLTALIDVSDGLAGDARQLSAASGVGLRIDLDSLPLSAPLEQYASREVAVRLALAGGEDYELLLCCAAGSVEPVRLDFETRFGVGLTRIGRVESGEGIRWISRDGTSVPPDLTGYDHFSKETGG